ncbi:Valyl-tRNA synthetase [Pseudomonas syringae pv. actinidiae]|uniref:Valyl-tRNA synthetase n=1 Tax=Pseudomonas syringae pv. actinidiae TaxID=103796 RepID=A0AAN4QDF4_PSESF|nr:Valyl-tRNA synthetase [Pseudomonas syringae pv. actinidiae]
MSSGLSRRLSETRLILNRSINQSRPKWKKYWLASVFQGPRTQHSSLSSPSAPRHLLMAPPNWSPFTAWSFYDTRGDSLFTLQGVR